MRLLSEGFLNVSAKFSETQKRFTNLSVKRKAVKLFESVKGSTKVFTSFKLYLYLGIVIAFLSLSVYTLMLRNSNLQLQTENEQLSSELQETKKALDNVKLDYTSIVQYNSELSKTVSDLRLKQQSLQQKLQKLNTNFSTMVSKHPKMVQNIINNSQLKTNECFEKLSKGEVCEN